MSDLRCPRFVAALLAICLLLSSLEVLWADALSADAGPVVSALFSDASSGDGPGIPAPASDEDDCPCLCACACVNAQLVALSSPPAPLPTSLPAASEFASTATPGTWETASHWRPPRA
ncbi:MAG: hypothetical protein H0X65_12400 [Gemmatimonadetes bacterium]|nr:hypothetical protein [Gemmatimonadota bacterium]